MRGSAAASVDELREVIADREAVLSATDYYQWLVLGFSAPMLLDAAAAESIGDDDLAQHYAERYAERFADFGGFQFLSYCSAASTSFFVYPGSLQDSPIIPQ